MHVCTDNTCACAEVGMGEATGDIPRSGCGQGKENRRKEEGFYFPPYMFCYCLNIFFNKEHVLFLSLKHISQKHLIMTKKRNHLN